MPLPPRGNGNPGAAGFNLQNPPVANGEKQQSYILGLPQARMPLRVANAAAPTSAVPGTPVEYQSGNPNIQGWDTRQQARDPRYGVWSNPGWTDTGNAKLPGDPQGDPKGHVAPRMPFQEDDQLGGWSTTNDKLVTRDRHVFFKVGNELSGRSSGQTDPPMDGPPRPSLVSVNRSITWQQGTVYGNSQFYPVNVVNGNADDLSRGYDTDPVSGRWIGEQGSGWAPVYGGVPGLYQPYGSYAGITAGPVKGIQSPVAQGEPGDGPRKVFSGPPHGLHSPTLPDYAPLLGYYMAQPAPRAPRQDRPDNSRISGQSYSQTVQPQGQTGTVAQANSKMIPNGNIWNKVRYAPGGGWRGQ